jgi:hypothetical protein
MKLTSLTNTSKFIKYIIFTNNNQQKYIHKLLQIKNINDFLKEQSIIPEQFKIKIMQVHLDESNKIIDSIIYENKQNIYAFYDTMRGVHSRSTKHQILAGSFIILLSGGVYYLQQKLTEYETYKKFYMEYQ